MDTAAYLKKQGWRGTGHSLDHTDRGIVKPLQISKKVDALGVGINKYAAVSDQWWLRAYDQGLKDFGTGKESALATAQKHGVNRGGLYARFVKGQEIPGTIGQRLETTPSDESEHDSEIAVVAAVPSARSKDKSKSQKLKRKAIDDSTDQPRKRRTTTDNQSTSIVNVTSGAESQLPVNNKKQIRAYIDEATKRGLLPLDTTTTKSSRTKAAPPSDHDMKAVLRLAKMHKIKKSSPQLLERKELIRKLKRAARKYLEDQVQRAPS